MSMESDAAKVATPPLTMVPAAGSKVAWKLKFVSEPRAVPSKVVVGPNAPERFSMSEPASARLDADAAKINVKEAITSK
jgi:hypothetical protein